MFKIFLQLINKMVFFHRRHVYHSSGLRGALNDVEKEKPGSIEDLKIKITAFTYHVRMATMSLQNFFVEENCSEKDCDFV